MINGNELKNLQVIKASAGSGKTYVLARTFIQHLLGRRIVTGGEVKYTLRHAANYQNHLLAITFTNKATAEMKSRIVAELHRLGKGKSEYQDYFNRLFVEPPEQIMEAAQRALSDILFNYTSFNVSTIDSFFQSIVRTFARELNAAYNYELQLDDGYATAIAVNDFLHDLGNNGREEKMVGRWVRDYIRNNVENDGEWNFFGRAGALASFAGNINREFYRARHDDIRAYLSDVGNTESRITRFNDKVRKAAAAHKAGYERFPSRLREFFAAISLTESQIKSSPVKLLLGMSDGEIAISSSSMNTLTSYALDTDAFTNKVVRKADAEKLPASLSLDFSQLIAGWVSHYHKWKFLEALAQNTWNLGLLDRIALHLEQYRHENNTLLMSDTGDLIATALASGNEFIYEHVGSWINHYLIDEFQDTSRKQYENFTPLLKGAIASGHQNLIIGDEKQSIYRFRNSDPSMLRDEVERDFDRTQLGGTPLSTNFRSQRAIVEFNNGFFALAVERLAAFSLNKLKKTYSHIAQQVHKDDAPGFVKIHFLSTKKNDSTDPALAKLSAKERSILTLPQYINEVRARGFAQRDIAILVDTGREGQLVIERILRHNATCDAGDKIGVVSSDSLKLASSTAVRLIVSMLESIESTSDNEAWVTVDDEADPALAKLFKTRLTEQRRHKIVNAFNKKLAVAPPEADAGRLLLECFEDDIAMGRDKTRVERMQLYHNSVTEVLPDADRQLTSLTAIVDHIIALYLGDATEHENMFILAFQDVVADFLAQTNGGSVREFLNFWATKGDSFTISSPETNDAVKVMTIHKSKGLQFPCVIIPFADWKLVDLRADALMWIDRQAWLSAAGGTPFEAIGAADASIVPPLIPVPATATSKVDEFVPYYMVETEDDLIDNFNKTYVAFTRAEEELHIFSRPPVTPSAAGTVPSVARLMRDCVTSVPGIRPEEPQAGDADEVWLLGEATRKVPPKEKSDDDVIIAEQRPMPPYRVGFLPEAVTVSLPPAPLQLP